MPNNCTSRLWEGVEGAKLMFCSDVVARIDVVSNGNAEGGHALSRRVDGGWSKEVYPSISGPPDAKYKEVL